MIQNIEIIVESFENGLTMKWRDLDSNVDPSRKVATDEEKFVVFGTEIVTDIQSVMNEACCNKVKMTIKYEPIKEEN